MKHVTFIPTGEEIAVNNIFCIGRNYAAHARELGNTVGQTPVVFLKPTSSLIREGEMIRLPAISNDVHHEVELCLLVGRGGGGISEEKAMEHVLGYGIGLDLTLRDVQNEARSKGLPWTIAKGFDTSAALSGFVAASEISDHRVIRFSLTVNGSPRQQGDTSLMLFPVPFLVHYLSGIFTLQRGDIIFTGTPEGVGRIVSGDRLDLRLGDLVTARFAVE